MSRTQIAVLVAVALTTPAAASHIRSSVDSDGLAAEFQTPLGLCLTARDAFRALSIEPGIIFIDVRTEPEFAFVGHAEGVDRNIPFRRLGERLDEQHGAYVLVPNKRFLRDVAALVKSQGWGKDAEIFIICRDGACAAEAVAALAGDGYDLVWSIVDGFEGRADPATGMKTHEGRRKDDLPWTYELNPDVIYRPGKQQ